MGLVDAGEQVPFDDVSFDTSNSGWLELDGAVVSNTTVDNLVNFIRGEEITGLRNRTVDYDDDGTTEIMRLGDIVHSTPTPSAAPAESYDLLSLDLSYLKFRLQYRNRRQVVYVGANDGMIHAFNGGFFERVNDSGVEKFGFTTDGPDNAVAHPLGSELWSYVPRALLPHLRWLADPNYSHVYYMDLKPRIFDARIFTPDTDHPDGWGTVLVVGMRFGGGTDSTGIVVDAESDGRGGANSDGDPTDDILLKSSYVILDITNAEKPPVLLGEISPPGLNLTTSFPAVAVFGTPAASQNTAPVDPNEWYLIFGNGPDGIGDASSTTDARLYAYDLKDIEDGSDGLVTDGIFSASGSDGDGINNGYKLPNSVGAASFINDPTIRDDDLDMKAEVLYFGTIGDTASNDGKLFRMAFGEDEDSADWAAPHVLLDAKSTFCRASVDYDR